MKQELRKKVIQYFRAVGSGQNIVQCIKQALFLHQSFSPVALFDHLSKNRQKLFPSDISSYLRSHSIIFNDEQLRYYLSINNFHGEITLNQFLQAMIPFNADVIRQFKQRYLQALDIKQLTAEVEFIFAQLLDNHFKFIRSLITLRKEITQMANRRQIESLIKEDLIMKSKPRESRKFQEGFQNRGFVLGFHQLRKFLELWLTSKQTVHQFYLLNVMRHLKSDHPFNAIIYKKKNQGSNISAKKRTQSANHLNALTNQKIKQKIFNHNNTNSILSGNKHQKDLFDDKYTTYKREVIDQFNREKNQGDVSAKGSAVKNAKRNQKHNLEDKLSEMEQLKRSRTQRNAKGIDGTLLIQMLSQAVVKEQRLQKLRKNVAKATDFNLINLFKLVDAKNKGYVTAFDLTVFMDSKLNVDPLIRFYGRQSQRLRFHEFCLLFRPLSRQLNEAIDSRQEHKIPNPFKKQTMQLVLEVLGITAQMHNNLNLVRRRMREQRLSSTTLFHFADFESKGRITADCLQTMLKENNVFCDDKSLKCLMKLFKKKVDEVISPHEFAIFVEG